MIRIHIDPAFAGPTLLEMSYLIEEGTGPIEVRWGNTRQEIRLVRKLRSRVVTLVVNDLVEMHRAATTVGTKFAFDASVKGNAVRALNDKQVSNWREFATKVGFDTARGTLVALASDAIQNRKNPKLFRAVVDTCLFEDVAAIDADVLLGLRASF